MILLLLLDVSAIIIATAVYLNVLDHQRKKYFFVSFLSHVLER